KLHGILNEEHRHVVAHQVPDAFIGIKLYSKATDIAGGVLRAPLTGHSGKPDKYGCDFSRLGKQRCTGQITQRFVAFKISVSTRSAGMNDTLGNPFVIEMGDLFTKNEVLQQGWPSQTSLERILVI